MIVAVVVSWQTNCFVKNLFRFSRFFFAQNFFSEENQICFFFFFVDKKKENLVTMQSLLFDVVNKHLVYMPGQNCCDIRNRFGDRTITLVSLMLINLALTVTLELHVRFSDMGHLVTGVHLVVLGFSSYLLHFAVVTLFSLIEAKKGVFFHCLSYS